MRCGYALGDQPVYLQAEIGVEVVRCPECGLGQAVGADAPPAWPGAQRRAMRTFRWLIAACLVVCAIAGSVAGLAQSTGFALSVPLADWIGWHASRGGDRWSIAGLIWWEGEGKELLGEQGETVWAFADWDVLTDLLWAVPIGLLAGLLYQAVFREATRTGHRIACGTIVVVSFFGLFGHIEYLKYLTETHRGQAIDLAIGETGWIVMYGSWAVIAVAVLLGIWLSEWLLGVLMRHVRGGRPTT